MQKIHSGRVTRQSDHAKTLIKKIEARIAKIAVIGLGYVGLPLSIRFIDVGYSVFGIDKDTTKIRKLTQGHSYIRQIASQKIQSIGLKGFKPSDDFSVVQAVDLIILCLPTPLNAHREPDLSYITRTLKSIKPYLHAGQAICLESTTYPGTTTEIIQPFVEACGFTLGLDFFVMYSPERENPGNLDYLPREIPKVTSGVTPRCALIAENLYSKIVKAVVPVSSTQTAEMVKLLENIHRAVNIGLVNEMKILADKLGIDIFEVIDAAKTKPFGFTAFYPGPGLGGHCIPIDPFYLTWKAREVGIHTRFIELTGEVNGLMPEWVCNKILHAMNEREKTIKNRRFLILGLAYKPDVDDLRESPALVIINRLVAMGGRVDYHDPYIPEYSELRSIDLTGANLAQYDCLVLVTHHSNIDYAMLAKHAPLIVDTRGVYRGLTRDNIVAA